MTVRKKNILHSSSTDTLSKLDVLWHDGDPLGVDGGQVSVLKESHDKGFRSLLKGLQSGWLVPQACDVVRFQSHGDFSNQSLERQSPDEILRGMLIPSYFFEGKLSSSIPSFFLVLFRRHFHAIPGCIQIGGLVLSIELDLLGRQKFYRRSSTGAFSSGLFRPHHLASETIGILN